MALVLVLEIQCVFHFAVCSCFMMFYLIHNRSATSNGIETSFAIFFIFLPIVWARVPCPLEEKRDLRRLNTFLAHIFFVSLAIDGKYTEWKYGRKNKLLIEDISRIFEVVMHFFYALIEFSDFSFWKRLWSGNNARLYEKET